MRRMGLTGVVMVAVAVLFSLFAAGASATDGVAPGTAPPPGTPMVSCPGPYPTGFPAGATFSYSANYGDDPDLADQANCPDVEAVAADLTVFGAVSAQNRRQLAGFNTSAIPVPSTPWDPTCTSVGGTAATPGAGQWTCSASEYVYATGQVTAVYLDFSWPGAVTRSVCGRPRFYDAIDDPLQGWLWGTSETGVHLSCSQFANLTYYLPQFTGPIRQRQTETFPWPSGSLHLNGRTLGLRAGRYRCTSITPRSGDTNVERVICTLVGHPQVQLSWYWDASG